MRVDVQPIDARKLEAAITPRTRVIMPVHIGGSPADMDAILAIGRKRNIPVVEDACQAHLAEWRGRKLSTLGEMGCFSFQASKNLNSGEGGCVVTNSDDHIEACRSFHNNGRGKAGASCGPFRSYFPIITSDALINAETLSPTLRASSSTASLVIDDVTVNPEASSTLT